jgi:CBS domain-containing protein
MQRTLGEVLRAKPPVLYTVPPDMTVAEAVQIMREVDIGAILVVAGDRLLGIFTERDLLRRVVGERRDPGSTAIERVMTADPLCVDDTITVGDALQMASDQRIRHLPVSRGGRLAGIVSSRDLTDWILRAQARDIAALTETARGAAEGITVGSG